MHAYIEQGRERILEDQAFIVSKTDLMGRITYANRIFLDIAQYTEAEVTGLPHNILRHPKMPKTLFKIVWETLKHDQEVFALIVNKTKDDRFYWVYANLTPDFDLEGRKIGYFSVRRRASREGIAVISKLYEQILNIEAGQPNDKLAIEAGEAFLNSFLAEKGVSYEEFIISIQGE